MTITTTPPAVPLILLVATFLVYVQVFLPRQNLSSLGYIIASTSIGVSISHFKPALSALSGGSAAAAVLLAITSITTTLALAAVCASYYIRPNSAVFPAIWTTAWYLLALGPVGRLTTWSPSSGMMGYQWLLPFLGTSAHDYIVASWALVVSHFIGSWAMGESIPEEEDLLVGESEQRRLEHERASRTRLKMGLLTLFLATLSVPSLMMENLPKPTFSPTTTSVSVGCILPTPKTAHLSPTLQDYIDETRRFQNLADILLWPETAVSFDNPGDRDEGLSKIQQEVTDVYVGVGFQEHEYSPDRERGVKRNGFALLSNRSSESNRIYYKQHLVPVAESFSLSPSTHHTEVYEVKVAKPMGGRKTQRLPISAAICLDFASPSVFSGLESRPALILGPARTWDTSVGMAMWHQASARANAIDSLVLWCDGGAAGISGIAGRAFPQPQHMGSGSWVATVGIDAPFNPKGTLYSWGGDWLMLGLAWLAAAAPSYTRFAKCVFALARTRRSGHEENNLIDAL